MEELVNQINEAVTAMQAEMEKGKTVKAAAARARKASLSLEKLLKEYRRVSIEEGKKKD